MSNVTHTTTLDLRFETQDAEQKAQRLQKLLDDLAARAGNIALGGGGHSGGAGRAAAPGANTAGHPGGGGAPAGVPMAGHPGGAAGSAVAVAGHPASSQAVSYAGAPMAGTGAPAPAVAQASHPASGGTESSDGGKKRQRDSRSTDVMLGIHQMQRGVDVVGQNIVQVGAAENALAAASQGLSAGTAYRQAAARRQLEGAKAGGWWSGSQAIGGALMTAGAGMGWNPAGWAAMAAGGVMSLIGSIGGHINTARTAEDAAWQERKAAAADTIWGQMGEIASIDRAKGVAGYLGAGVDPYKARGMAAAEMASVAQAYGAAVGYRPGQGKSHPTMEAVVALRAGISPSMMGRFRGLNAPGAGGFGADPTQAKGAAELMGLRGSKVEEFLATIAGATSQLADKGVKVDVGAATRFASQLGQHGAGAQAAKITSRVMGTAGSARDAVGAPFAGMMQDVLVAAAWDGATDPLDAMRRANQLAKDPKAAMAAARNMLGAEPLSWALAAQGTDPDIAQLMANNGLSDPASDAAMRRQGQRSAGASAAERLTHGTHNKQLGGTSAWSKTPAGAATLDGLMKNQLDVMSKLHKMIETVDGTLKGVIEALKRTHH